MVLSILNTQAPPHYRLGICNIQILLAFHFYRKLYLKENSIKETVLFILTKTQEEQRRPLVGDWINKPTSIQTVKCYSGLKGNELTNQKDSEEP